jgi:WD40 repeat protein
MKPVAILKPILILIGILALVAGGYAFAVKVQIASQPVFSTSWYGTANPSPISNEDAPAVPVEGRVRSFALSPDGRNVALATSQGIIVYDLDAAQTRVLNVDENFFSVDWSPDGKNLAAGGLVMQDSEIGKPHLIVWTTSDWKVAFEPKLDDSMSDTHYGDVAWSPNSRHLATSNGYMGVTTFDIVTGKIVSEQGIFAGATSDISWSPNSSRLTATGDMAYAIRRWKIDTDEWVRLFDPRASFSLAVQWAPDGKRIASGHTGGAVCLWTAATNQCDGFIYAHQSAAFSLAWSPDGTRLATGGGVIRIWDSQSGLLDTSFGLSDTSVYAKLVWPKPDLLISLEAGYEEKAPTIIRFWDVTTGEILMEFQGDNGLLWQ